MQLLLCNDIILVPWDQVWNPELAAHMLRPCLQSPEPISSAFGNRALGLQPQSQWGGGQDAVKEVDQASEDMCALGCQIHSLISCFLHCGSRFVLGLLALHDGF